MNEFHGYYCRSGCGHTTILNKHTKNKRQYCANCGTKETLEYIGEFEVARSAEFVNVFQYGLKPKTNVWLRSMSSYAHKQAKELKVEAQDAKYHVDVASKAEGAKEVWEWVANAIDTRLRRMLN